MGRKGSRNAFLLFLAVLLVIFFYMMRGFLVAAGLALVTTIILRPMHRRIETWCRGRRYIAAIVSALVTIVLIMGPLGAIVTTIIVEVVNFSQAAAVHLQAGAFGATLDALSQWIGETLTMLGAEPEAWDLRATVVSAAREVGSFLYSFSPRVLLKTANFGLDLAIWILFLFVLFADGFRLYTYIMDMAPLASRHEQHIAKEVREMVSAVFLGMLCTALANAILMAVAFAICGIERPLMWALVTFGFSFIPVVGATSIWVGGASYLLLTGDWAYAVSLAAFGLGIMAQTDNVIKPLVMRGRVNVHPVLLLLSILGGLQLMGPPGLVFGPVFIAIFLAALHIYRTEFVETEVTV